MQKKGLGRGLSALLGENENNNNLELEIANISESIKKKQVKDDIVDKSDIVRDIDLVLIEPNKDQPRRYFDPSYMSELKESIKLHGVITPIIVVPKNNKYMIVAGERRFRACMDLGIKTIPVIIKQYSNNQISEISIIDNIQRQDLNVVDIADSINKLIQQFGYTQERVAERLSMSRSHVTNLIRILSLNQQIKQFLIDGSITMGHAKYLLSIEDSSQQYLLAKEVVASKLSVRELEQLIKDIDRPKTIVRVIEEGTLSTQELSDIIDRLKSKLNTKIIIDDKKGKGKIVVHYNSKDELNNIVSNLCD